MAVILKLGKKFQVTYEVVTPAKEIKMIKELVMEVTNSLPDTATFDDIIEAIYTRIKIEKGLNAVKEGKGLSTEELLEEMKEW